LAIINPIRDNPLDGEGIILIDEIDLHLHPKWQRMIVTKLREVFPNCQFLVSTHSPHVMTHVQPESLFLLSMTSDAGMVCERPSECYGKTVERILEDLMGLDTTRPDPVNLTLKQIFQQIDEGQLDQARATIAQLQNRIGDDPELSKAAVMAKRKELIGK
jgi:predicted ATP-binding protein involved in virulence